ncbi:hypothetical protein [Microvirga roseola]|uniref:hypothetical protein n=1 Tax=Microvirga roseola TaxID=2883126 RepID=UPI001E62504C|nr:hypothetical protein [Microvirga roseola]
MSAGKGSDIKNEITIYVRLIGEGTDVWRPVRAEQITTDKYCILEECVPPGETWEFQPGDVVKVRKHIGQSGEFPVASRA